jgi:hypothetical protein
VAVVSARGAPKLRRTAINAAARGTGLTILAAARSSIQPGYHAQRFT